MENAAEGGESIYATIYLVEDATPFVKWSNLFPLHRPFLVSVSRHRSTSEPQLSGQALWHRNKGKELEKADELHISSCGVG